MNFFMRLFLSLFFVIVFFFQTSIVEASSLRNTDSFVSEIKTKIHEYYNVEPEDIIVEWVDEKLEKKILDLKKIFPKKNIELKFLDSNISGIIGKFTIPVQVYVDDKLNRTVFIRCKIDVYKPVLIAKIPIRKGEIVTEEHVKISKAPSSKLTKIHIIDTSLIVGKTSLVDIKENSFITSNLFKERVVVFKGNQVTIRIRNGDLILIASGEALQEGAIGQMVSVKVNTPSKKVISAKIIDQSLVEVNLGGN